MPPVSEPVDTDRDYAPDAWRPVTDWETLCHAKENEPMHQSLRDFLSQSICHLAESKREMLYKLSYYPGTPTQSLRLKLAIVKQGDPKAPSRFIFAYPHAAIDYAHKFLKGRSSPEAGIETWITPKENEVYVSYFGRNLSLPSELVDVDSRRSKPSRVLFCAASAMAAELLMYLQNNIKETSVRLSAADEGDGKLFNYYRREFGFKIESHGSTMMKTTLFPLLVRCKTLTWFRRCKERLEDPSSCDENSFLSRVIARLHRIQRAFNAYRAPSS